MTRSRTQRVALLVVAAATASTLSACSQHPGAAAVVGSESIGTNRLDSVAGALCAAQSKSQTSTQQQDLSSRAARQGALDVLINGALSSQFGASRGVQPDQEQVSSALAANARTISSLPRADRAAFRSTLKSYAEGQLMLISVGKASLARQGRQNATDQQAVAEGTKLRDAWVRKNLTVSVDPRFGTFRGGALRTSGDSLSVAQSFRAKDGAKNQPSAAWVSGLPASQKCS